MAAEANPVDKLQVAIQGDVAIVRVRGRGSFKISTALKEFAGASIDRGCSLLVLDMAECIGMDSTFMGVLAGLSLRLKKQEAGGVVMVNLSLRTRGLLATLGLDEVIEPHMAGDMPERVASLIPAVGEDMPELVNPERSTQETAQTMLEAHEDLVRLSPDNLPKFKDVLAFLQEDVRKAGRSDKTP